MGVKNLSKLLSESTVEFAFKKEISDYSGKILAFDAFNVLYQFLATIRDQTGQPLKDREGRVTSHLIGILTRNSQLLRQGVQPIYVFDGKSHELKKDEVSRRVAVKKKAEEEYKTAMKSGDTKRARSLAQRTSHLTSDMIDDSKVLLRAMGIPVVQAPGEGEAQAAQMVVEGTAYAVASQDYDALLFGANRLVRNLNLSGKRNLPNGKVTTIYPEEIRLPNLLDGLNITREQLIDLGILLGSDFNPDGFKGVGIKTAFKFIKKYGNFLTIQKTEKIVGDVEFENYETITKIFSTPNIEKNVQVEFGVYDAERIINFLIKQRGFSEGRHKPLILKTAKEIANTKSQTSLNDFF